MLYPYTAKYELEKAVQGFEIMTDGIENLNEGLQADVQESLETFVNDVEEMTAKLQAMLAELKRREDEKIIEQACRLFDKARAACNDEEKYKEISEEIVIQRKILDERGLTVEYMKRISK